VREKALWRFLYETAARASEALAINVEDVDLDNKRVRVRCKVATVTGSPSRPARPGCCPS
jgi:integrase